MDSQSNRKRLKVEPYQTFLLNKPDTKKLAKKSREKHNEIIKKNVSWSKKLYNMRVTVIPIIASELGTVPKCLLKRMQELEI